MSVGLAPYRLPQRERGVERGRRAKKHHVARNYARMIVHHGRQPRPRNLAAGIQDQDIELGMVRLPCRVRASGTMPMHHLETVSEYRSAVMSERQHCRVDLSHDIAHAAVGWRGPSLLAGNVGHATMDRRDRWRRLEQRHPLDQFDQFHREGARSRFRSRWARKAEWPIGTVACEPAPGGADCDAGVGRHLSQRHLIMEVRAKHRHTPGNFGAVRFRPLIIRHGDLTPVR